MDVPTWPVILELRFQVATLKDARVEIPIQRIRRPIFAKVLRRLGHGRFILALRLLLSL